MVPKVGLYILFWLKKNRLKNGKAPISARIKINGVRSEFSTDLQVSVSDWDSKLQFVLPSCKNAKEINKHIIQMRFQLQHCQNVIEAKGQIITIENIKKEYYGIVEKPRMLIEILQQEVEDIKKLIGIDYVITSWRKYRTMYNLIKAFVKWKFGKDDIPLDGLKYSFITDFEFYLKTQRQINPGTNPKYLKNFQRIIRKCVLNEWLDKDPFYGYRFKVTTAQRGFLNDEELETVRLKSFGIDRLDQIKDLFVFSCYTSLSYIDIFNLTKDHISIGIDGKRWIFTNRQKTKTPTRIPLLPPALEILNKYAGNPVVINTSKLLPVASNQKVNAYLKEIADCCGIKKKLTFHMARHTFATTVTLNNGVPIESVSKMMGHTKIQTTQIYAHILDKKVSKDMDQLEKMLEREIKLPNMNEAAG